MISRVVGCVWLLASLPGSVEARADIHRISWCGPRTGTTRPAPATYSLGRDMADLFTAPPDDVLMLKVSWWIGR